MQSFKSTNLFYKTCYYDNRGYNIGQSLKTTPSQYFKFVYSKKTHVQNSVSASAVNVFIFIYLFIKQICFVTPMLALSKLIQLDFTTSDNLFHKNEYYNRPTTSA